MATSILLRYARSALRSTDLATRCLPAVTGATGMTSIPLISQRSWNIARLFSSRPPNTVTTLERKEYDKVFEVTDDIANSEAKLHALFLKWLSHNERHFDIEDNVAFKKRFEIFKEEARYVNEWNKGGHSSTCGLNAFSDLTRQEFASGEINSKKAGFHRTRGRSLGRKANQAITNGPFSYFNLRCCSMGSNSRLSMPKTIPPVCIKAILAEESKTMLSLLSNGSSFRSLNLYLTLLLESPFHNSHFFPTYSLKCSSLRFLMEMDEKVNFLGIKKRVDYDGGGVERIQVGE
ncbi:hypothetical protein MKX03_016468 [Papaver bracteatum]|nr:hypothetical protein MKX03_016468 [Papaver bracteatum]